MQFIEKFGTEDFMKVILISCIISVNFFLQINESSDVDGLALTKFFVRLIYGLFSRGSACFSSNL